ACLFHESRCVLAVRDVGLDGAPADLLRKRLRFLRAGAVADDHGRTRTCELGCDRAPDPARRSGDECRLAFEPCKAPVSARDSCRLSRGARLLTEMAVALGSRRLTRPESPLPGPASTNVFAAPRISSDAACVKPPGAVS